MAQHQTPRTYYFCFIFTQNGTTPLFVASEKDLLDIAHILIGAGAKVDIARDVSPDTLNIHVTLQYLFVTTNLPNAYFCT